MSTTALDRLYELLPVVHRQRDTERGHPLRDLLRVIGEQVQVVEDDIARMYENWFIETCDDWVVPYLGDLVGYQVTNDLAPRRDVANYVRAHRRRGTVSLLELLAADTSGLPARAVEFFSLLARTQSLDHLNPDRGRFADLRDHDALDLIDTPFDRMTHTADIRHVTAKRTRGHHNIPSAAAYLWRLRAYSITRAPAYYVQRGGGYYFYTFNVLGNDAPLVTKPVRESDLSSIAGERNVPMPIRRHALLGHPEDYYGPGKSFTIWYDDREEPVPVEDIVAADLSSWKYRPPAGKVAVDPKLGRFAVAHDRGVGMTVSYHYGFTGDVGAGEYARTLTQPRDAVVYRVGPDEQFTTIRDALDKWEQDNQRHAVVEIADSGVYSENIDVEIAEESSLQLRAANRTRPVITVLDRHPSRGESLHVILRKKARFTLDGIVVAGRPVHVEGDGDTPPEGTRVVIRRCTLVPGWTIDQHCHPSRPTEASLDLRNLTGKVTIDHTITGSINVTNETEEAEPLRIDVRDTILDATANELEAVLGPGPSYAWAKLRITRTTVFGTIFTHAIELGENSIFGGEVRVARRQIGCIRFCWVPPGSRTPRRYHCQPDLVDEKNKQDNEQKELERLRVAPRFDSVRFGSPTYARLALDCADEIAQGADDESEMGAFHENKLPQRIASLRVRLDDSTPAGMETGIIYAD
ncbi:MAG TPA: hypothetical protein VEK11_15830 [Thermoanaerobaculia bacterium]|nr:hypothetical protein [Thermoanaerobaculia bacterium]